MLTVFQNDTGDTTEDDFEVVPLQVDNDVEMWDAANENEDEIKQQKIKSKPSGSSICAALMLCFSQSTAL